MYVSAEMLAFRAKLVWTSGSSFALRGLISSGASKRHAEHHLSRQLEVGRCSMSNHSPNLQVSKQPPAKTLQRPPADIEDTADHRLIISVASSSSIGDGFVVAACF